MKKLNGSGTQMNTEKRKRTIDPEDKARRIFESARKLFVERGYYRVSIPDIVRSSGVSTGAIYNLFGSKENLAKVLHKKTLGDFNEMFLQRLNGRETTQAKLLAFTEVVFELTEKDPAMMEYLMFMKHAEFMEDAAPVCFTEPFQVIRRIIAEGMEKGDLKPGDVFLNAVSFTGAILRPAQLRIQCVLQDPLTIHTNQLMANAWAAIKA
ncbi:TetR/AcrR family transcriptional regulator [Desulfurivibrio alkaliphilus]|uniref:Transcriptional regulator, TetR family n=1 Tax=Desulfurivibrio alkaliphilus (strain DSM 19089 / UNIQEM U267 / AHT2) TaxID=589865 RepID=D6YZX2_DESAT|nr:TetR/AcrR family transcriptional regulator [Desulfurivibrio alkaliphilus]ADH85129.1 transcriptional regulator, TetR family [Desulfurivibrio alkaliphilus AHT 2]